MQVLTALLASALLATSTSSLPQMALRNRTTRSLGQSLPFQVKGTQIVNGRGEPTKFSCFNWPGHMEMMIPEGLNYRKVEDIAEIGSNRRFNCVRLTFATEMATANATVEEQFKKFDLGDAYEKVKHVNSWIDGKTSLQVFDYVIDKLIGQANLNGVVVKTTEMAGSMMNISTPSSWKEGLKILANRYNKKPGVIGFGLRNELRTQRQNGEEYAFYMYPIAEELLKIRQWLIFAGGIQYATDLSFIKTNPPPSSLKNHLVWEFHWYPWTHGWDGKECSDILSELQNSVLFAAEEGHEYSAPLFLGEWGYNLNDIKSEDDIKNSAYLTCITNQFLKKRTEVSWGIWGIQGSYYLREGQKDFDEGYGLLSKDWETLRSPTYAGILRDIALRSREPSPASAARSLKR